MLGRRGLVLTIGEQIEQEYITVWDYCDVRHGGSAHQGIECTPQRFDVEAWCVGGKEGIRAFFFIDERLYEASGDDGHWWLVDTFHVNWLGEYKEVIDSIEVPFTVRRKIEKEVAEACDEEE